MQSETVQFDIDNAAQKRREKLGFWHFKGVRGVLWLGAAKIKQYHGVIY